MQDYNFLDLFSGVGGFALGARNAGFDFSHHFNSDVSTYANAVYARHFPESLNLGDIRKINGFKLRDKYPGEWIVCGGFPFPDLSTANRKRKGLNGERSGLFFEMLRLIDELRPSYVLAENVAALTFSGLDRVLLSLAKIGYDAEWQTLSAASFGAPHQRDRLWLLAYPSGSADASGPLLEPSRDWIQQFFACRDDMADGGESDVCAERDRPWSDWAGEISAWEMAGQSYVRRVDALISEGVDVENWQDRGIALGNSVVPVIPEFLFRLIKDRSDSSQASFASR